MKKLFMFMLVLSSVGACAYIEPNNKHLLQSVNNVINPAAIFCQQQGGISEKLTDVQGKIHGICRFADGKMIDEWSYFRANNPPLSINPHAVLTPTAFCVQQGGKNLIKVGKKGHNIAYCQLRDGKVVEAGQFYRAYVEKISKPTSNSNLASDFCRKKSGKVEIWKDNEGKNISMCRLPSGEIVEQWSYYFQLNKK